VSYDPFNRRIHLCDKLLLECDALCVKRGQPILSVLVVDDNGSVSKAALQSAQKYDLRLPGEDDGTLIARLREEAFGYWGRRN
jgi:hypothetical protein